MAGRCPACGEGGVFVSLYRVRPTCLRCGVRYERDVGSWLGAMVVAYVVAIVFVLAVAAVAIANFGLFRGLEWVLIGAGFVTVVFAYRPAKGWWLWWMWAAGFVTRDGEDEHALVSGRAGAPGPVGFSGNPRLPVAADRSRAAEASAAPGTRGGDEQRADDGERHQR